MITPTQYIDTVLSMLPQSTPRRAQIAAELRDHIDEGMSRGTPLDRVLADLGAPVDLATSYLAAVPLVPASHGARLMAKVVDAGLAVAATALVASLAVFAPHDGLRAAIVIGALIGGGLAWFVYTVLAEHRSGATFGKRRFGLHVVRESGARIGLGQAIVRQLPLALEIVWLDALFVLFTDRRQRAFELLSKTRVVQVAVDEAAPRA